MEPPPSFFDTRREIELKEHRLPHWQQGEVWVFVTWRLRDSLPKGKLALWSQERDCWINSHPQPWDGPTEAEYHERFSQKIDDWLDQGSGSCLLKEPADANLVADSLLHFDRDWYDLASFVVMPNHVHVLFRPRGSHSLADIVKSWKGFSARAINKHLGRSGSLWQEDYWDRLIRHEAHFLKVLDYIRDNPAKAGCRLPSPRAYWSAGRSAGFPARDLGDDGGLENPPSF